MLKRTLLASLALSAMLAGCGGSNGSDDSGTRVLPGTYGVTASAPNAAPTDRLYQGNVTVAANGTLSGFLFGTVQNTTGTVSGTVSNNGTLNLTIAFTQPVSINGRLTETNNQYTGRLDGTVQTGANTVQEFEADVVFGPPLS